MNPARRAKEIARHLRELVPKATLEDFMAMQEVAQAGHLRHLPPSIAAWQAVTSRARHGHTEYDKLLEEGYDSDSARHFILEELNDVLTNWGCVRQVEEKET